VGRFFVELADIVDKEDGNTLPNILFSFGDLPDAPPGKKSSKRPTF